jgi:uncharacterized protein GlcG (DUF336 family)
MSRLTLEQAQIIIRETLAKGRATNSRPLTVSVLDAGGHLKAFASEDQSSLLRPEIATGKAFGALIFGTGTRVLANLANERPYFFQAITTLAGGKAVPMPGGLTIRQDRQVIGAVGVSGDTPERDEECGLAGIEAAGLKGDTGPRS